MIRHLVPHIESRLVGLPAPVSVQLPEGQLLGTPDAPVKMSFSHWSSLTRLRAGQIGALVQQRCKLVEIGLHRIDGLFVTRQLEQGCSVTTGHSRNRRIFCCHELCSSGCQIHKGNPSPQESPEERRLAIQVLGIQAGLRFFRQRQSAPARSNRGFASMARTALQRDESVW